MTRVFGPLCILLLLISSAPGWAADGEIVIDIDFEELGQAYALLVSFTAAPEIAASSYTIESDNEQDNNNELKTIKLPLYREFRSDEHEWHWYAQGTVNYSTLEEKQNFQFGPPLTGQARFDWTGYGGLLEVGIIAPMVGDFSWAAGIGAGVSRLESVANFDNPVLEAALAPALDGTVYNWKTDTTNVRGNLGLLYDAEHGNYGLKGSAHYTYTKVSTFNESERFSGFSDFASALALKLDIRHPLQTEFFGRPSYIVGHIGQTNFLGDSKDDLGFNAFTELGASLGVEKFTLGVLVLKGSKVEGWNIVFNYDY